MRSAPKHLSRWSLPLLIGLLAACGGGSDDNSTKSNPGQATPSGNGSSTGTQPPAVIGERLNSPLCALDYVARAPTPQQTGADPLLRQQWFLNNTGSLDSQARTGEDLNLLGAWTAGKGEGVRVAIIDDAIEVTHDDLLPNVVANGSFNYLSYKHGSAYPMPCSTKDTHGTAVAGVIAARDNNRTGGAGVAPRASIVGFNAIASGADADVLDAINRDLDKNHIYNNSWGANDDGHFYTLAPSIRKGIEHGISQGRKGLGAIYVFAAGNGGCLTEDNAANCTGTELSTYDGHVTQLGTLAVCATNIAGQRASYSEPGANLLVCAPSGERDAIPMPAITTTAPQNEDTSGFNGTSAAAPMVSGVAALMLQANPNLSWRDVRLVLAQSARRVDSTSPNWTTFGGLHFNHEYGFGAADADAAVKLARNWQSVGGSSSLRQCGPFRASVNRSIPENATAMPVHPDGSVNYNARAQGGLQSAISVPASCGITQIEHVQVNLAATGATRSADHPDAGNLHITLTSPSGQTSTLVTPHECVQFDVQNRAIPARCQGLQDFSTGLTRHMAEPVGTATSRDWILEAVDRNLGDSGQLSNWQITFYGR
ncbi:MAG: S8 family serine peptidase [Lautropia sp.]|nr:S8 family serine peptidase [Lautropia sp.]